MIIHKYIICKLRSIISLLTGTIWNGHCWDTRKGSPTVGTCIDCGKDITKNIKSQ